MFVRLKNRELINVACISGMRPARMYEENTRIYEDRAWRIYCASYPTGFLIVSNEEAEIIMQAIEKTEGIM